MWDSNLAASGTTWPMLLVGRARWGQLTQIAYTSRTKANMTQQEFLVKVSEMLEVEPALSGAEALSDLEVWDSLAVMSYMALVDAECGIVLAPKDIGACRTVNDLVALVYERNAA